MLHVILIWREGVFLGCVDSFLQIHTNRHTSASKNYSFCFPRSADNMQLRSTKNQDCVNSEIESPVAPSRLDELHVC